MSLLEKLFGVLALVCFGFMIMYSVDASGKENNGDQIGAAVGCAIGFVICLALTNMESNR
jgi:hypothetical protein